MVARRDHDITSKWKGGSGVWEPAGRVLKKELRT
jgi:hypothetical protein